MEVKVTQADRDNSAEVQLLFHRITESSVNDIRNGEWDDTEHVLVFARHRIASQAELIEALEPFARAADGRKDKGIAGAVCFQQPYLLKARSAIAKAKGE